MTRFTVLWDPEVEESFINLWIASDSETRWTLTQIANWVDTNLSVDPDQKGEERVDLAARTLAVPVTPARVSVAYQILPEDRVVRVVRLVFKR